MEVQIIIGSHKRAGRVTSHKHFANTKICVPESQYLQYRKYHKKADLIAHPDSIVGMSAKREYMYRTFGDMLQLDDDCIGMFRVYRPPTSGRIGSLRRATCTASRAYDIVQATADTAKQMGCFLFGFGSHAHPASFRQLKPFRFGGYTPSGAVGLLSGSKLFFPTDTTLPIEDYWICLLNSYMHRKAWLDCRFSCGFRATYTGVGGFSEFRVGDAERQATLYLKKYFGDAVTEKRSSSLTKTERNRHGRSISLPYRI